MKKAPAPVLLIVEDDDGHATLIERNLVRSGVNLEIKRLSDGQAALDYVGSHYSRPSSEGCGSFVALMDIRMPKVSGIEVLRSIKEDPATKCAPVIMLSTTDDPREIRHCYELGCNAFVRKPIDYSRFTETVQALGQFLNSVILC